MCVIGKVLLIMCCYVLFVVYVCVCSGDDVGGGDIVNTASNGV